MRTKKYCPDERVFCYGDGTHGWSKLTIFYMRV